MRLLLALVAASNEEHGRTIGSSHANGTDTNRGGCTPLHWRRFRLVGRQVVGVIVVVQRRVVLGSAEIPLVTGDDANGRVDVLRQVVDELHRVIVEARVGDLDIHAELVDHALRVVEPRQGCDVSERLHCVIRNEPDHLDVAAVNLGAICEGDGQVGKDLGGRHGVVADKLVVLGVKEPNLEKDGAFRLRNIRRVTGTNDAGQIGRHPRCRRGGAPAC